MKSTQLIILVLFIFAVSCRNHDSVDNSETAADASATITHEDGWTIISKEENGNLVYWFLAPDVDGVSPAMFKKVINTSDKSQPDIKIVSECEASKKLCDELNARFKEMSEKYQ
jgi:hypothetical protein